MPIAIHLGISLVNRGSSSPPTPPPTSAIELEDDSGVILLETGDIILLESA